MNLLSLSWWRPAVEIGVFTVLSYYSFLFLKGTRAYQVLKGVVILLIIYVLAKYLEFTVIAFILGKIFGVAMLAFVILFQPEIRRAFVAIGRSHFDARYSGGENAAEILTQAVSVLKEKYIGALIVIARQDSLRPYIDTGISVDAKISMELMVTFFTHRTPLHDGAVILDGERVVAASCLLPLSQRSSFSRSLGTRHRAGIGLTEETDAFVIIVSEETGHVSLASGGEITSQVDLTTLKKSLEDIFHIEKTKRRATLSHWFGRVFATGSRS
jgi:diadenylate cyclase